uniref:Probable prefoldin subunit 2 n=2 Tax=Drosophila melanogaster TaxID=7227 RepID=PFD2_DROME|nr:prefoldin 2, isoform B [Drosophila melanogaster]NP_729659.1 prefoldin 2, isoform A [Drosophila melanogaster]Q9VTE5.1 RecName: Full=Probable prefoldin subunit 2 [Drosophila melanogaster]AOQ13567.1 l(3)01239-PA [synthetic construct]AAF50107.1 prefoldin 2, isoform A [Drosophila melanogaster]ACT88146.1 LD39331p [Drosophila melanogaster]AGB94390.1 prefoldin 2, isoform B [Drosophila melanogaster]|eukprot:NP_001261696.1 prefoldin 2, isoform B [Drosophila melanogaster]
MSTESAKPALSQEAIVAQFQQLRNEQRNLVNSLNTLEMDLREHKTVIETLEAADPERKCFRQIGGVLCERTVKEVLPQLVENKDFIAKTIQMVTNDLSKKGSELNKFKEEHNIKIRGEHLVAEGAKGDDAEDKAENRNVLVFN